MAHRGVIVKHLAAIQNLGSMDVLCTDKTGTLTEARIRLEQHIDAAGRDSARVLELAYLNSYFETGLKSPLDDAILAHGEVDVGGWRKIDEVPFDFERRRVSVLVEKDGRRLLVVKGAPEDILRLSVRYEDGGPARSRRDRRCGAGKHRNAATTRWATTASARSGSPGARPRPIMRTPWSTTRPSWCSPGSPPFSIRPRQARQPRCRRSPQAAWR